MLTLFLTLFLLQGIVADKSFDMSETSKRRTEKVLKPIFKTDVFTYLPISSDEYNVLYKLYADSLFSGYLVLTSSLGRAERFEYFILLSPKIEVQKVNIIQYHSTRGTGVTSKRWLKQFEGNRGETLRYGKDVQAISGATFSATSITKDVPRVTRWVNKVVNCKE